MTAKAAKAETWRSIGDSEFLASWDLEDGQEVKLTISSAEFGAPPSSPNKKVVILGFEKTQKRMICNATNCKVLHRKTGTGKIQNWVGQQITVYVKKNVRDPAGGTTNGLRIKI